MSDSLSSPVEQWIAQALATGMFTSREAVLETAVQRMMHDELDEIPPEHAAGVQQAIDEIEAGAQCVKWDPEDFMKRYMERYQARQAAGE